jgi:hypothetical protein
MRTFEGFNADRESVCPWCKTSENKETILVPILGTEDDGIVEARQMHTECVMNFLSVWLAREEGHA